MGFREVSRAAIVLAFGVLLVATPVFASLIGQQNSIPVAQEEQSSAPHKSIAGIKIGNFGVVDNNYYRGAQPAGHDYEDLKTLGVKTVIDLQESGVKDEPQRVQAAGMKFFRIGLSDNEKPNARQADAFLKIVTDPANQPVFVHCHGGRDRTGAMTAVYRLAHYNWNADKAISEMKAYKYGQGFGHGAMKDFVLDYYNIQQRTANAAAAAQKAAQ